MEFKGTLEEASQRAVKSGLFKDETLFVAGAKWQAERMYYLIEALNAIESIIDNDNPSHEDIWRIANGAIEQFKKTKDGK